MIYQTYELMPHRVNQFAMASYRHTFENSDGYQFGDEVNVSAGLNIIPLEKTPWLTLIQQCNFHWVQNDAMDVALYQFESTIGTFILLDPTHQIPIGPHDRVEIPCLFAGNQFEPV